ncbi:hypothetical protein GCM10025868_39080 [Angustibacter aerolatus]|uniref:ATPase AAA-type core domain-containing protein n=1 Tax=Angustibacter aerolatus TaxID=1162965 RepID=A0ABQ6JKY2_9ACTN|nr:hypothetical protein [Angustibacter aerolatus]GMA88658.1 hypothetical protein GCM10025868_39080 [Angustibacter aerolatus]
MFFDEPTAALDPQARRNLWDVLREVQARGTTVVYTTHYLDEAEILCDRVAIMDAGTVLALDTPAALVRGLQADTRVALPAGLLSASDARALPGVGRVQDGDGEPGDEHAGAGPAGAGARRARPARRRERAHRDPRGRLPPPDRPGVPRMTTTQSAPPAAERTVYHPSSGAQVTLARAMLRSFFRDRTALFFTFFFPLMFLVVFGLIFANPGAAKTTVGVVGGGQADRQPAVAGADAEALRDPGRGRRRGAQG